MRAAIWRNTVLTAGAYIAAIVIVDRMVGARLGVRREMELALAFAIVQAAAILLMMAVLFGRKQMNVVRAARSRRLAPQIEEALALHAVGIDQRGRIEQLGRRAPRDVREALYAMLASMRGDPRERLAMLAASLGLTERGGQPAIDWIRNVVRLGHAHSFQQIAFAVAHQGPLIRSIAAEELAPWAGEIAESQLLEVLHSTDADVVVTALDMIRAWRRARPVPGIDDLLAHSDARVRARTLLALPYAAAGASPESMSAAIIAALEDGDAEVRLAAANAAGKLGVTEAVPALGAKLGDPRRDVAVAAAFALASLGPAGNDLLQKTILSPDRAAASAAFEAVEKAALGLVEMT